MGRETIELRKTEGGPRPDARIIDAEFTEFRGPRSTFWGKIKAGLQALLWAAAIGFLIPPALVLLQRAGDLLRPF